AARGPRGARRVVGAAAAGRRGADPSMRSFGFAWRSLTRAPARAALGVAGGAIVGGPLFGMVLLSRGRVLSVRELLLSTGFDVRVTATKALPGSGRPIAAASRAVDAIASLPEVARVAPIRFGRAWARSGRRAENVSVIGDAARGTGELKI